MVNRFCSFRFLGLFGWKSVNYDWSWYSWQTLTNHKSPFSNERNSEILAPKASTHSAYSLWNGELLPIATIVKGLPWGEIQRVKSYRLWKTRFDMLLVDFLQLVGSFLIDLLICKMVLHLYIKSFSRTKKLSTLGAWKMVPGYRQKIVSCSHLECPSTSSVSPCWTPLWNLSLAASTKQWITPELAKLCAHRNPVPTFVP